MPSSHEDSHLHLHSNLDKNTIEYGVLCQSILEQAQQVCHDHHLKLTPIRRKVLELILNHRQPLKAYDLLNMLKQEQHNAKPITVYRALDFLIENQWVHKLNSINAFMGCRHPQSHDSCYFLICHDCGNIDECCNIKIDQTIYETVNKNEFDPLHISVEIQGICKDCRPQSSRP